MSFLVMGSAKVRPIRRLMARGALGIRDRLALGRLADKALAFIRECDDGGAWYARSAFSMTLPAEPSSRRRRNWSYQGRSR